MTESYLRRASRGELQDFPEIVRAGMQDYASRLSVLMRGVPPDDYAMMVVVLEDLAASMRAITPQPLQESMDGIRKLFTPTLISGVF